MTVDGLKKEANDQVLKVVSKSDSHPTGEDDTRHTLCKRPNRSNRASFHVFRGGLADTILKLECWSRLACSMGR